MREEIIERVPHWARTVLDVGCGSGALGRMLKSQRGDRLVVGVEIVPEVARRAAEVLDQVITGDVSVADIQPPAGGFDVIVCADVLEHLVDPWSVIARLAKLLSRRGVFVLSLPNLRNLAELARIAEGSWDYSLEGIFDRTHLRYFTVARARELVETAGLRVHEIYLKPDARLSMPANPSRLPITVKLGDVCLERVTGPELSELTAYQIVIVAGRNEWPSQPGEPDVSIVIVNWNGLGMLQTCLEAVRANSGPAERYEIVVVDNGSTDGSAEFLAAQADVRLVSNTSNVGFTLASNQGAEVARGRYLVFLNNDTRPQPGWLDALIAAAAPPDVGAVGAKLVYPDGRLQEAGGIIFADGSGWNYGRGSNPDLREFSEPGDVDYCSAAALLVKAHVFWAAGAFDPRYAPAYYEDSDLCFAIRNRGWRVIYEPRAVVQHVEGATAGRDLTSGLKRYQVVNKQKFVDKWAAVLQRQYPARLECVPLAARRVPPLRILVVDVVPPVYDRASGSQRLFQIVQMLLEEGHSVAFFCWKSSGLETYVSLLRRMGVVVVGGDDVRGGEQGKLERLAVLLASFAPNVVWIEGYQLAALCTPVVRQVAPEACLVLDTVDLHFVRERRLEEVGGNPTGGGWQRTRDEELSACANADVVITVTELERDLVRSLVPAVRVAMIPNVHEPHPIGSSFSRRSGLIFVGNFFHHPNLDGVGWFLEAVWPLIVREEPAMTMRIVGNAPPPVLRQLCSQAELAGGSITLIGYVPDVLPYLGEARVSVAPLRAGAGMKGKIAEALAAGLPVVSTSVGAEGMGLQDGKHVLIADNPEAFAEAVLRLYRDRDLWHDLSMRGLALVKERYGFDKVRLDVRNALKMCLRSRSGSRVGFESKKGDGLTSIVIPCWNEVELTRQCVDSVFRNTTEPFELIVVDNGSTDETPEYLQALAGRYPNVRVIRNEVNTGFAYACNQGIDAAGGSQIVVMNNDVVVPPGWLSPMLRALRAPGVGIVGPRTNQVSGSQQVPVPYAGDLAAMEAYASKRAHENKFKGFFSPRAVAFCMLIKREVVDRVGGFDFSFGMGNFEDDDFCIRAQLAGFRIWIADDAFVYHLGSRTFLAQSIDYAALMRKNLEIFRAKWFLRDEGNTDGIPYGSLLTRAFDPEYHRCPLTPQEVASRAVSALEVAGAGRFNFLLAPDWKDPRDRWLEAIAEFVAAFPPEPDVALLVRIDPLVEADVASVVAHIERRAESAGIDLAAGHKMIVVNDLVPPVNRAAIYRAAQAFIDTAPPGVFRYAREEARACGLTVCEPSRSSLELAARLGTPSGQ
ncbi:MAG: glycosyltransferase [Firmicutes bacterium]|nr:glycosyltransferase [Bacillota bacterium]